jgi:hypothetical protein
MPPLEKKQFRGKLLPYSDLQLGVFLEEKLHFRSYSKEGDKQQQHQDWNMEHKTFNQGEKPTKLQKEMEKMECKTLALKTLKRIQ